VSPVDGVRSARDDNKLTVLISFGVLLRWTPAKCDRIAMNDQGWHINAGQIIAEISEPGRYTSKVAFAEDPTATFQLA